MSFGSAWQKCSALCRQPVVGLAYERRTLDRCRINFVGIAADNPDIPQLWAQKIIALNYLAHGHQTRAIGLAQQPDKAAEANEEEYLAKALSQNLLSTLKDAVERFPEDSWFIEMRDDAWKHFGTKEAV